LASFCKIWIITIGFQGKRQIFSPKIAESYDHNIEPCVNDRNDKILTTQQKPLALAEFEPTIFCLKCRQGYLCALKDILLPVLPDFS
jgi:hypothetical protein